jgi:uncharacterized membrane protein
MGYTTAGKSARLRKGFLIHLTAYLAVNLMMVAINLVTNPEKLWFYWPMAGWGIGILAHGIAAYSCQTARA